CTCPVGVSCKHAVAVVVDYLEAVKNNRDVPTVTDSDRRLALLDEEGEYDEYGEDEYDEEDEYGEDEWEEDEEPPPAAVRRGRPRTNAAEKAPKRGKREDIRAYLEGLPADELVAYVLGLAGDYPEINRDLQSRATLAGGQAGEVIRDARKEIRRL